MSTMEWVEITARTVDEARDIALDRLGVDEDDADIEVLEEPKPGLFGRLRGQARVRARVRPATPRPKAERRDRRRGRGKSSEGDSPNQTTEKAESSGGGGGGARRSRGGRGGGRSEGSANGASTSGREDRERERATMPELTIDQQTDIVVGFLEGLAGAFGVAGADVSHETIDEGLVEVRLDGEELGPLVGPKGTTLQAVQELARTVVQRQGGGTQEGRLRIDIARYRQRRKEALERFTHSVAEQVLASGSRKALEPMHAADRKVVHDTANSIEGVRSVSEGEEPRRRVVLVPDE